MTGRMIALAALAALGGCSTTGEEVAGGPGDTPAAMTCNADRAQSQVGQQASEATGAAIIKASGARSLRWGPPNSAWTMDYRPDRVNARYDAAMTIVEITCG